MATERRVYVFRFRDHELPDVDFYDPEFAQMYLQVVSSEQWVVKKMGGPGDFDDDCDTDLESIEELMNRVREVMEGGAELPPEVVQIPFDKLARLMTRDGWRYIGGAFQEFEPHLCDNEIRVILERSAGA